MTARHLAAAATVAGAVAAAGYAAVTTTERRIEAHAGSTDERDHCPRGACYSTTCTPDYCRAAHRAMGCLEPATRVPLQGTDRALGGAV